MNDSKGVSNYQNIQLQTLFDRLHAGVIVLSCNMTILYTNKEAARLLGLTVEQMAGKEFDDPAWTLIREDGTSLPLDEYPVRKVLSTLQSIEDQIIGIRKSQLGELVWVQVNAYPEFDTHNKLTQIVVTFVDVTARKKSDNEMNILFEIVQGVLHTSDLSELLKLIHLSLKKLMYAENCFFALHNEKTGLFNFPYFMDQFDDAPQPTEMLKSCTSYVYRTGNSIIMTPVLFQKLAERKEIELIGSASPSWIGIPLKTSSGTIGVLVLQHYAEENIYNEHHLHFLDSIGSQVANVIVRKRAENELEKSHSLITATLESTADGILVVDKSGKITSYNSKFAELWQIPESILNLGDDDKLLQYATEQLSDPEGFTNKVKELYNNEHEISTDFITFKDGKTFERYSQSQICNGKYVGRVWSFRNITQQKEMLKALRESELSLLEINATKDKFFSIIAHDLKSPFSGILGFSSILADQIKEKNYENIEEYADIIQYSSQKAIDLLTNLMEWSRSQSGRMDFNPQTVEFESVVNEVFELLNIIAVHKSILITKEIENISILRLDKDMISSVLRNLISNAIKFTNPGGCISIKAYHNDNRLNVLVEDTGIGIDSNARNKLFKIDESYSIPGTNDEKGTGLGLILCKEFIDKHNGKIWVESDLGKGSRFYFTIPDQK